MSRAFALVALLALIGCVVAQSGAKVPPGKIKHFVVLMMENRAFDHMLGWMHEENPNIVGLNGTESNPWDFNNPASEKVFVTKTPDDETPSPNHSINGTSTQIFGTTNPSESTPPTMKGFVMSGRHELGDSKAKSVMDAWTPEHVPIISTLARNFALFDQYHASVPGPTDVNRLYFHSATSHGDGTNDVPHIILGYPQKSLYELIDESGYDWRTYFGELPDVLFFQYTRAPKFWDRFELGLDTFYHDVAAGDLPTFTFLSPNYFGIADILANDQHPAHAVSAGEELMKKVYEAMRNSPLWESSALLLTYDEHGGFYDHVSPPSAGVPNPDGLDSTAPPFNFQRLGVRIPTILISPWVDASVIHAPTKNKPTATSQFEHTSLIASLTRLWGLNGPLTKRDAWAAPWDYLLNTRSTPRTDCPKTLPPINKATLQAYHAAKRHRPEHTQPLSELHKELLQLGNAATGLPPHANLERIHTEEEGGIYLQNLMREWIDRNKQITIQAQLRDQS